MKSRTDQDGKSKTASAVDGTHYPEQHEVVMEPRREADHHDIAELAYHLWMERGQPDGSAEQDWYEAAEMLRGKVNSSNALKSSAGSVQR